MITLLTLYQCDKFIIHRAKNTLLYVLLIEISSNFIIICFYEVQILVL